MEVLWRQAGLMFALLVLPIAFAVFCIGMSRHRQGRVASYLAYYFLFGFAGQWLLAAVLWPSGLSRMMCGFLLTAAPAACLGLAVTLQKSAPRIAFDAGALIGCYLYLALLAAGAAFWL